MQSRGLLPLLIAGVTFANLQTNTVALADNQISTSTHNLQIWDAGSSSWDDHQGSGFTINDLAPGDQSAKQPFYLKNNSGANLALTVAVPGGFTPHGMTNLHALEVTFYDADGHVIGTTDLQALLSGVALSDAGKGALLAHAQGNSGVPGTDGNYSVSFKVNPLLMTGSMASVSDLDFDFTGTAF